MARVDALIEMEWNQLASGHPEAAWDDARKAFRAFRSALGSGDRRGAQTHLLELGAIIEGGVDQQRAVGRLLRLIEHDRRLVETNSRIVRAGNQTLTVEEVAGVIAAMGAAIRRAVPDPTVRGEIIAEFDKRVKQLDAQPNPVCLSSLQTSAPAPDKTGMEKENRTQ